VKILLTGGTGFFGKSILRYLHSSPEWRSSIEEVTVLSRNPGAFLLDHPEFSGFSWLTFHQGDILQPETLPRDGAFTHVLHCAADSTQGTKLQTTARFDQIVDGTRYLLDFSVAQGVQKFLLASSGGVYGPQPLNTAQIEEDFLGMPDPLISGNAYGVGKRVAEHLCALYQEAHGLDCVIARCFAFVGPDLPLGVHFAIGNFIRDALKASPIAIEGDGTPLRSYLYQTDLAEWMLQILVSGTPGEAYNVGSDIAISIRDLALLIRDLVDPKLEVEVRETSNSLPRQRYVPSIEKIRHDLGLDVTVPLSEAILLTVDGIRKAGL